MPFGQATPPDKSLDAYEAKTEDWENKLYQ